MSGRVFPLFCPYCAGEDLRPHGAEPAGAGHAPAEPVGAGHAPAEPAGAGHGPAEHGTWECRSCTRVFTVTFVGLVVKQ